MTVSHGSRRKTAPRACCIVKIVKLNGPRSLGLRWQNTGPASGQLYLQKLKRRTLNLLFYYSQHVAVCLHAFATPQSAAGDRFYSSAYHRAPSTHPPGQGLVGGSVIDASRPSRSLSFTTEEWGKRPCQYLSNGLTDVTFIYIEYSRMVIC